MTTIKFAHIADVHLGGWREPKIRDLATESFERSISIAIENKVDFVLICGDLFNTSLPSIDSLKTSVQQLKRLKVNGIRAYSIAGSHDFSPVGKTILDVLEDAGLLINVFTPDIVEGKLLLNFHVDEKTGAKIAGMLGKKGMLERRYYEGLDKALLEDEQGFKIFMFHTAISELKGEGFDRMDSSPLSLLPKGFDYYAGGHVHIVHKKDFPQHKNVVYPGPTFPNSFAELEKLGRGGMYIYEKSPGAESVRFIPIELKKAVAICIDCQGISPDRVTKDALDKIKDLELADAIVLLRFIGELSSGRTSDIDFRLIIDTINSKRPYFVMKSTSRLSSVEFDAKNMELDEPNEVESQLIAENAGKGMEKEKEIVLIKDFMSALDMEKGEGEKNFDYEARVNDLAKKVLERYFN